MNIKELTQLIESNTEEIPLDELYNLFYEEHEEIFEYAHSTMQDSQDELDGVDVLVGAYSEWISSQDTEEALADAFVNRTMEGMTEHFFAALT